MIVAMRWFAAAPRVATRFTQKPNAGSPFAILDNHASTDSGVALSSGLFQLDSSREENAVLFVNVPVQVLL
jgi:hypothetical protein